MAILVEEQKNGTGLTAVVSFFLVIVIVGIAVIYIFFVSPEKAEVIISVNLKDLSNVAKIKFDPQEVLGSESFKSLKSFDLPVPLSGLIGKSNPFLP